jgi:hypothetical protein
MRRLTTALTIAVLALATCTVALAGKGDPKEAFTKVDQARAKSMLLRRSDLAAGFKAHPSSTSSSDAYCKGDDESDLTLTGKAQTPDFVLTSPTRFFYIGSEAEIYRTAAQALVSWRRATSPAGEKCARKIIADELTGTGPSTGFQSFAREPFPNVAPLTIAYRVTAKIHAAAGQVTVYFDVVALQRGRAQAVLFIASGGAPLARAETLQFARLLSGRMARAMKGD